jgi:hypothetical protein
MHVPGSTPVFAPTFKATSLRPGKVMRHLFVRSVPSLFSNAFCIVEANLAHSGFEFSSIQLHLLHQCVTVLVCVICWVCQLQLTY